MGEKTAFRACGPEVTKTDILAGARIDKLAEQSSEPGA